MKDNPCVICEDLRQKRRLAEEYFKDSIQILKTCSKVYNINIDVDRDNMRQARMNYLNHACYRRSQWYK